MKKQKKKLNHYRKKRIPITIDYRKAYKISFAFKSKTKKKSTLVIVCSIFILPSNVGLPISIFSLIRPDLKKK